MIDQGLLLYKSLKPFPGNSPMFPIGVQVDAMGEAKLHRILEIIEEEYRGIPVRCFKLSMAPYPPKRHAIMVCFRQQDRVYAIQFKMRLTNDI